MWRETRQSPTLDVPPLWTRSPPLSPGFSPAQGELSEVHEELGRTEALRDAELSDLREQHESEISKAKADASFASEEVRASLLTHPLPSSLRTAAGCAQGGS